MRAWLVRAGLGAVALLAGLSGPPSAHSQSSSPSRTPQERREQLAKVQEQLGDPDPLMRLAYMEDIMASGDGLRMQIAMRTAFASDDPDLRAIALRAYLASHKEFTFDVILPPDLQKLVDSATSGTRQELNKRYPFLVTLTNYAYKIHLKVTDYKMEENVGGMVANAGEAPFSITGDELSMMITLANIGPCYIDFSPTRKQALEGTIACGQWPKLGITTRAF